ncbi:carboxypeptidase-like regulatory domain-containing protein [Aquimarina rhabdastrellae]
MKTIILNIFLILFITIGQAQSLSRVLIDGKVNAAIDDIVEGIVVLNISSKKGTVTNAKGEFKISAAEGDKLEIIAVQYEKVTIAVDKSIIDNRRITIFLNETINELEEVVVRPYDLLGNVAVDIQKIKIDPLIKPDLDERQIGIDQWALGDNPTLENIILDKDDMINGINFVNLFKLVVKSKKSKAKKELKNQDIDSKIRNLYNDHFFKENLKIKSDKIDEFIFFAEGNGLDATYLEDGNELRLLEFLVEQSQRYKKK